MAGGGTGDELQPPQTVALGGRELRGTRDFGERGETQGIHLDHNHDHVSTKAEEHDRCVLVSDNGHRSSSTWRDRLRDA